MTAEVSQVDLGATQMELRYAGPLYREAGAERRFPL